jgi:hypothetical protein
MFYQHKSWSLDDVKLEAAAYLHRSEFEIGSPAAYQAACRHGWLEAICVHMEPAVPTWTYERTSEEARLYCTRAAFRAGNQSAYNAACRNGWLDKLCAHMNSTLKYWADEDLECEARKYETVATFKIGSPSAYTIAARRGLLPRITSTLSRERKVWCTADVLAVATTFATRQDFLVAARGAYKHAYTNGYLDQACAHMAHTRRGFNATRPGSVYLLHLESPHLPGLVKVGVTNARVETRVQGMRIDCSDRLAIVLQERFDDGAVARAAEVLIHAALAAHAYHGPRRLANGNTELFSLPLKNATRVFRQMTRRLQNTPRSRKVLHHPAA